MLFHIKKSSSFLLRIFFVLSDLDSFNEYKKTTEKNRNSRINKTETSLLLQLKELWDSLSCNCFIRYQTISFDGIEWLLMYYYHHKRYLLVK